LTRNSPDARLVLCATGHGRRAATDGPITSLRSLEVEQEAECVILRGSVDSFYHKQLAQELLKTAIDGVEVINEIHVDYSRPRSEDDSDWLW
jgi:hypothetical protein